MTLNKAEEQAFPSALSVQGSEKNLSPSKMGALVCQQGYHLLRWHQFSPLLEEGVQRVSPQCQNLKCTQVKELIYIFNLYATQVLLSLC